MPLVFWVRRARIIVRVEIGLARMFMVRLRSGWRAANLYKSNHDRNGCASQSAHLNCWVATRVGGKQLNHPIAFAENRSCRTTTYEFPPIELVQTHQLCH